MKRILSVTVVVLSCLMLFAPFAMGIDGKWEFLETIDGVDLYRMTHPGTKVCTFKGVGFVDAKIEVIGAVLRDIEAYPTWMARCKKAEVLKRVDRNTFIVHYIVDTPFPYMNRDVVLSNKTRYDFNKATAVITFGIAKDYSYPEQPGCFRMPSLEGEYYLEYFGRNKTRVTYMHRADPGGNIPITLANRFEIQYYPVHYIQGIRRMVKKRRYIEAGLKSPEHELIEKTLRNKADVANILKNRIGRYIIDPVLLNMLFNMTVPRKIVDNVYATRSDFKSIRQGMIDLFCVVGQSDLTGKMKKEVDELIAYLSDKQLDSFFSMERFMDERWLVDAIAEDKKLVYGLFNMKSDLARVIFEKITTSPSAVTRFIRNRRLAERILADASLRKKLWNDYALRERLAEEPGSFKSLDDFEKLIAERVESYQM